MAELTPAIEQEVGKPQTVRDAVIGYIVSNGLHAGQGLPPEAKLAQELGVGRSSIREALKSLEAIGLVETRRGVGVFVKGFSLSPILQTLQFTLLEDSSELADLLAMRCLIEKALAGAMIRNFNPDTIADLDITVARMKGKAVRGQAFPEEDRQFHRQLLEGISNTLIVKLLDTFWLIFRQAVETIEGLIDPDPMRTYELHKAIVRALEAGDVSALEQAIEDHYAFVNERISIPQRRGD